MGDTNTHKVFAVSVDVIAKHEFRFLFPNHLLDENGGIDDKTKGLITYMFRYGKLDVDDLETPHHKSVQSVDGIYELDKEKVGTGYQTFVENDEGGVFE